MTYDTQTRAYLIDPADPDPDVIERAARVLRAGGLVAFPTETVYGLGANALNETAIDQIYAAKQRPAADPVIVHIYNAAQLDALTAEVPRLVQKLAAAFWPGALTLVLKRAPNVPANIAAGLPTVAVRMPAHPVALALLRATDTPIAAPSANTFTRPSATTAAHVLEDLDGHVDVLLDGGPTTIGLESTVLDLSGDAPVILRPGGVTLEALQAVEPTVTLKPGHNKDAASVSPGQMVKHYSPRARLVLYQGKQQPVLDAMLEAVQAHQDEERTVGVLVTDEDDSTFTSTEARRVTVGTAYDLDTISQRLFAAIRELDTQGVDVILARDFGREGLGAALWDRLLRAAEGEVITVG
jgi:L-threonylcarbamoyladenylate synthase